MASGMQDDEAEIHDFILARELAEVYLLMDHISACECKDMPPLDGAPIFKNSERSWLEQICDIAWPPEEDDRARDASNAAKLIRAKDALNKAAAPATGGSIAFTLMVAGESRDPGTGSWLKRAFRWMADMPPSDPAERGRGRGLGVGWPGGKPPSRASLAALAYPALSRRAWRYRVGLYCLLIFLVAWLLVTCILSWDVATGNSLLNRATVLDARVTTLESAITAPATPGPGPQTGANAPARPSDELDRAVRDRTAAWDNLGQWMARDGWIRRTLVDLMGGDKEAVRVNPPPALAPPRLTSPTPVTNSEWAAVMLGILASNILPIFYGLLGAGAAVVRLVSVKMRDSLLAPRDILLAYVQLALGAVIGACIGLFVNSEGQAATADSGLLGSVPLSASALCFVAGLGVEGVFQALESLIRRVFNLDTPR